jgi:hypothetical protein
MRKIFQNKELCGSRSQIVPLRLNVSRTDHYLTDNANTLRLSLLEDMVNKKTGACGWDFGTQASGVSGWREKKSKTSVRNFGAEECHGGPG